MANTGLYILITALSLTATYLYFQNSNLEQPDNSSTLNIILMGDYGTGEERAEQVADKLDTIADDMDFLLTFGDNFYEYGIGKKGMKDKQWKTTWEDVYQSDRTPHLAQLDWYGTIGNHDYRGAGMESEFEYHSQNPKWILEGLFWSHTASVGDRSITFLHIDTNFLAYGKKGESDQMAEFFKQFGWKKDQQILDIIEDELKQINSDWVFVMAHHPVGYACREFGNTGLVVDLLQKYQVDGYFAGHSHMQSYSTNRDILYLLSGNGAKHNELDRCDPADIIWENSGNSYGFMTLKIHSDFLEIETFNFEDEEWTTVNLPNFQRRIKSQEQII